MRRRRVALLEVSGLIPGSSRLSPLGGMLMTGRNQIEQQLVEGGRERVELS